MLLPWSSSVRLYDVFWQRWDYLAHSCEISRSRANPSPLIINCWLSRLLPLSRWNVESSTWDPVAMELHWPCGAADCMSVTWSWSWMVCFDSCRITCGTGSLCMNDHSIKSFVMVLIKHRVAFDPVNTADDGVWVFFGLELYRVSDNLTLSTLSDRLIRLKTWRLPPAHFSSGFPFILIPGVCLHSYGRPLCLYWPL